MYVVCVHECVSGSGSERTGVGVRERAIVCVRNIISNGLPSIQQKKQLICAMNHKNIRYVCMSVCACECFSECLCH